MTGWWLVSSSTRLCVKLYLINIWQYTRFCALSVELISIELNNWQSWNYWSLIIGDIQFLFPQYTSLWSLIDTNSEVSTLYPLTPWYTPPSGTLWGFYLESNKSISLSILCEVNVSVRNLYECPTQIKQKQVK